MMSHAYGYVRDSQPGYGAPAIRPQLAALPSPRHLASHLILPGSRCQHTCMRGRVALASACK